MHVFISQVHFVCFSFLKEFRSWWYLRVYRKIKGGNLNFTWCVLKIVWYKTFLKKELPILCRISYIDTFHTVNMWKKIQEFAGTTFIKQKRLEIVNNWQIDAKKPNASSPFCVNAYFRVLRNFTNFVFSSFFKVRPSSSVVEQWPLDLRLQVRNSLFSILFFTLFCYFQWQTTLNFCEKYTLLNTCDWNAILL